MVIRVYHLTSKFVTMSTNAARTPRPLIHATFGGNDIISGILDPIEPVKILLIR
jgi:hypothetical protein